MYNTKDIQFTGKHDYDKESALSEPGWNKTFSVGIFKWELKSSGKEMKKGKIIVRVSGEVEKAEDVFNKADEIVKDLDRGSWRGKKSVTVK